MSKAKGEGWGQSLQQTDHGVVDGHLQATSLPRDDKTCNPRSIDAIDARELRGRIRQHGLTCKSNLDADRSINAQSRQSAAHPGTGLRKQLSAMSMTSYCCNETGFLEQYKRLMAHIAQAGQVAIIDSLNTGFQALQVKCTVLLPGTIFKLTCPT